MLRQITLALAAAIALGTTALAPAAAHADGYYGGWHYSKSYYGYPHWNSYGHYYKPSYFFHGPRFAFGPRYFFHGKYSWKKRWRY